MILVALHFQHMHEETSMYSCGSSLATFKENCLHSASTYLFLFMCESVASSGCAVHVLSVGWSINNLFDNLFVMLKCSVHVQIDKGLL